MSQFLALLGLYKDICSAPGLTALAFPYSFGFSLLLCPIAPHRCSVPSLNLSSFITLMMMYIGRHRQTCRLPASKWKLGYKSSAAQPRTKETFGEKVTLARHSYLSSHICSMTPTPPSPRNRRCSCASIPPCGHRNVSIRIISVPLSYLALAQVAPGPPVGRFRHQKDMMPKVLHLCSGDLE